MVFYKGSLQYKDLMEMPIDEVLELNSLANKLSKEFERQSKKK